MVTSTAEELRRIMDNKDNIRNTSVIGHFNHGKSTLTNTLVAAAGNVPMTNARADEVERSNTIKSSAFSLHYALMDQKMLNEHLINLIDSPGHTDFSSEVTAALRVTDGALLVVDCIEGVCVGTDEVLRQALSERIYPVLILNKMDKCFLEHKYDGEHAYKEFHKAIEMANETINANKDSVLGHVAFDPKEGNVAFSSGLHGWAFTLSDFARMYAKNSDKESLIMEHLWGDKYIDLKTRKWTDVKSPSNVRGFVFYCYDPIKKVINACMNDDKKDLFDRLEKYGITMEDDEKKLMHEELMKCVMQKWLPAATTLCKLIICHLPSPHNAQEYRVENLYDGPLGDIYGTAIKECDPDGPLMMYVSKMIPASDKGSFFAFGRVFAGKISTGLRVRIMGPDDVHPSEIVKETVICLGTEREAVQDVPCGNIVALVGLDQFITKNATLTNDNCSHASPIRNMEFTVSPVMFRRIQCLERDRPKLVKGLEFLNKSDLMVTTIEESGEHLIAGSGELHLEMCLRDLKEYIRGIQITVSPPAVLYHKSDLEESSQLAAMPQLLEPFYLVEFQAPELALYSICYILQKRHGTIVAERHTQGTPLVNCKALIPVAESFGLHSEVKKRTNGQASSLCVYHHWEIMKDRTNGQASSLCV